MTVRYNFKLVEKHIDIDLSVLPKPVTEYGEKATSLYGIDAVRFSGFEGLDSPLGGLKFLNKIWNLEIKKIEADEALKQGVEYYMKQEKFHNVIALIRKAMNNEKALSPFMLDSLYPFIPYIVTKMREHENYK